MIWKSSDRLWWLVNIRPPAPSAQRTRNTCMLDTRARSSTTFPTVVKGGRITANDSQFYSHDLQTRSFHCRPRRGHRQEHAAEELATVTDADTQRAPRMLVVELANGWESWRRYVRVRRRSTVGPSLDDCSDSCFLEHAFLMRSIGGRPVGPGCTGDGGSNHLGKLLPRNLDHRIAIFHRSTRGGAAEVSTKRDHQRGAATARTVHSSGEVARKPFSP